jgi:transcriptional regulator with XRE-family HTH domain
LTLAEQLKILLDKHFNQNPHISVNSLAKKSGVSASTLRRIINGSLKGDPSAGTVLNIISAITKERKLSGILKNIDGPIGKILNNSFGHFQQESLPHTFDTEINQELSIWPKYFIYKMASNKNGIPKKLIKETFGNIGVKHLNELNQLGLIYEKEEVIHCKEKDFCLDIKVSLKHLPHLLEFYKPDEVDKGQNLFYSLSESLSPEGIKKIKEVQKDAIKKIYNIMNSPYYEGEIPFFSISLMDTLNLEGTL